MTLTDLVRNNQELFDFCEMQYMQAWDEISSSIDEDISDAKREEVRREAQREAIDKALINCLLQYPDEDENLIWSLISAAHKFNLIHLDEFGLNQMQRMIIYDRCISAHQSWNKASGHSFERFVSNVETEEMRNNEIKFLLKNETFKLLKNNKLVNTESDLDLIRQWAENFDLYAVQTNHGRTHIFGCVQIKTSIRDRVGRDDQFSKLAMDAHFWVAEAVLNGDFFNLPKYYAMVNGGSVTYPENNWHGVYVLSGIDTDGRIYKDNINFETMGMHSVQAAEQFIVDRSRINRDWIART